jgi:ferric-dicitrate binding protein FerR (iron transport regulator)
MEQNKFISILRKYQRGAATPKEKRLVDEWYASIGEDIHNQGVTDEGELEQLYHSKIYPHVKKSNENSLRMNTWYYTGIAASILLTVITYFFVFDHSDADYRAETKKETSPSWKQVANNTQITRVVVLPDSSKVSLEPESRFRYLFSGTEREVYLDGEAFFEVTHNPDRPFLVHANEVTTKVLGTSFTIKALEHEQRVIVAVRTGKVSVYTKREREHESSLTGEIILTPNQQIVFDKKEKDLTKTLVQNPRVIIPKEEIKRMRFEEAPVTEIFKALEKAYGVNIEFDEVIFSSCELTTVIADEGIYSRLDIICDAIGTHYTLDEDRIIINGTGCNSGREN